MNDLEQRKQADQIIRSHMVWSIGAGLIPVPVFDIAAVTAVQVGMLEQLALVYGVRHNQSSGRTFVSALTGSAAAKIGASMFKALPGVGTVLGGLSMSVMSGASTYAVGQVAASRFAGGSGLSGIDKDEANKSYEESYQRGKEVASDLTGQEERSRDVFAQLDKLGELKDKGVISDQEFEQQKKKLLERI